MSTQPATQPPDLKPTPSVADLLKQLSGVQQPNFLNTLLPDLACVFDELPDVHTKGQAVLETLEALQPKDVFEFMLCIQMVAMHREGMHLLHKLAQADGKFLDRYANASTKLLRLYSEKLEALTRYRRRGEQHVRVEHVHVHEGAKAVIGNVQAGGGGGK